MAHLTRPTKYDIKDSNIALLGSDLEKCVREHAGDSESAWTTAGLEPGVQVWRIEKFDVVIRPTFGEFYDGDSYIILHTYKKNPEAESLSYNLHFWLGEDTSQDEAGTAAYKTVELDDHLHGVPVQYREVQGHESPRFLTYFPRFVCLRGGVDSGFRHVSDPVPVDLHLLYKISITAQNNVVVRQVAAAASSLVEGDVYVLDKGAEVWQFNTEESAGKEKFKAAEFVRSLVDGRQGQCDLKIFDEGSSGAGVFLTEFGAGTPKFEEVPLNALSSADAFLLDASSDPSFPTIYVWLGKDASLTERRLAPQYAQRYLHEFASGGDVAIPIVKMREGDETDLFTKLLQG
ncbi:fragmin60 [Hymenopellis radicata]|nr:fragmin60 [Hymenopellis radicata]